MEREKTIAALNTLITINNDRIEDYETALNETEENELKTMFSQFISTSRKCKQELETEVSSLGGKPAEGTKTSGKFFRMWMDVKAALTGKDRKAILSSCEFGEEEAENTYNYVLESDSEHLNEAHKSMVLAQLALLKADQSHVKTMRNALAEA